MSAIETTQAVEVEQAITTAQFRTIEALLGKPLGRHKEWCEKFYFEGDTGAIARVWEYVCDERIRATMEHTTRVHNYAEVTA